VFRDPLGHTLLSVAGRRLLQEGRTFSQQGGRQAEVRLPVMKASQRGASGSPLCKDGRPAPAVRHEESIIAGDHFIASEIANTISVTVITAAEIPQNFRQFVTGSISASPSAGARSVVHDWFNQPAAIDPRYIPRP